MNDSCLIITDTFQEAWIQAVHKLKNNHWDMWSLIVQVKNSEFIDKKLNSKVENFAISNSLLKPKTVAYTIFPYVLFNENIDPNELYKKYLSYYNYPLRKKIWRWGTYFYRMINYANINQLDRIIKAINQRNTKSRAAYTIIIEKPGGETIRPLGAPCLNYLAIQYDNKDRTINILATYRNHDFLKRAYGNYLGLCKLIQFIAKSTNLKPGRLTCISSHAYIGEKKTKLKYFLENL
jgi:thymidylate synthase